MLIAYEGLGSKLKKIIWGPILWTSHEMDHVVLGWMRGHGKQTFLQTLISSSKAVRCIASAMANIQCSQELAT